jgi:putative ABC transport system permease protein
VVGLSGLRRKLLRDIAASKAQYGAVVFVIVLGVAIFIASFAAYQNLYSSYENSYQRLRMADYWISVDKISSKAATEMDEISGVTAQGRIIGEVVIDLETDTGERVAGRVISLPSNGHPSVNDIHIENGDYFIPGARREILLEKHFAEYHNFSPGDSLILKLGDVRASFQVAGIATSPEYIWVAKNAQEPFTSPRNFGVFFMPEAEVENMFDLEGYVNEIDLIIDSNADTDRVFSEVRQILRNHHIARLTTQDEPLDISTRKTDIIKGVRTAHMTARKDQIGDRLLRLDLEGFREIAELFPALFLIMAALAIYVLLNRLVESQRVQIGLMRAIGYSRARVVSHYLGFAVVVGILGSILGGVLGYALASVLTQEYAAELKVPFVTVEPHLGIAAMGMLVGIIVPFVAACLPSLATSRMYPAEAMRPVAPVAGHRTLPEILFPFLARLPQVFKLPMRNVFRNLRRSAFMAMGVASAVIMIMASMSFIDAIQSTLNTQFEKLQDFDARVIFGGVGSTETASFISHLQGIEQAEAILEWPYRLRHIDKVSDSSIMGLPTQSTMYHLIAPDGTPIDFAENGILITQSLKKKLNIEIGDELQLEPIIGTVGLTEKRVTGFVDEPLGSRVFLPLEDAQGLLKMPGAATGILLRFTQNPSDSLLRRLYDLPQTASVEFASETRQFVNQLMSFFYLFIGVMLIMGGTLGLSIVFNGVTINVLERRREYAVMRAVGMSRSGISTIITLENLATGLLGIIVGILAGQYVANFFLSVFETDIFSLGNVILPRTYYIASLSALVILFISQVPAIMQVYRLRLSTATKTWAE